MEIIFSHQKTYILSHLSLRLFYISHDSLLTVCGGGKVSVWKWFSNCGKWARFPSGMDVHLYSTVVWTALYRNYLPNFSSVGGWRRKYSISYFYKLFALLFILCFSKIWWKQESFVRQKSKHYNIFMKFLWNCVRPTGDITIFCIKFYTKCRIQKRC